MKYLLLLGFISINASASSPIQDQPKPELRISIPKERKVLRTHRSAPACLDFKETRISDSSEEDEFGLFMSEPNRMGTKVLAWNRYTGRVFRIVNRTPDAPRPPRLTLDEVADEFSFFMEDFLREERSNEITKVGSK